MNLDQVFTLKAALQQGFSITWYTLFISIGMLPVLRI